MYEYSLKPIIAHKSHKSHKKILSLVALLFLIFIGFVVFKPKNNKLTEKKEIPPTIQPKQKKAPDYTKLLKIIEDSVATDSGTYSIYFYDINNQTGIGINEHMVLSAASVNKIPILASLYHLAGKEEINLDKQITLQAEDIQDYGSGTLKYQPTGTIYSVKTLARLMMEKSDNTASYILANHILQIAKIQKLIDGWGLTQTNITSNKTSVYDMCILLIKIYKGEITNAALTAEMLDFMDKSDYDDRLPAGLPPDITIYHKTGDNVGKIHDVGIINYDRKPYYLGIFTSDMTNDQATKANIAKISKAVFDYIKNL